MTWEELCEKAREKGAEVYLNAIYFGYIKFDKDGSIWFDDDCGGSYRPYTGRTYDQMYQIMEALR